MILRVETVRSLKSDLIKISSTFSTKQITIVASRRIRVRLAANIDTQKQWKKTAERLRFLQLCVEDEEGKPCVFNVVINRRKKYEIANALRKKIVDLPAIRLDFIRAMKMLMNVLQHLTTLKFFKRLGNRLFKTFFHRFFSLMTIFNLSSSWRIVNLVSVSDNDDYWIVSSKREENNGKKVAEMRMKVSDFLKDHGKAQSISFLTTDLPKINLDESHLGKPTRDTDDISKFLSELTRHSSRSKWYDRRRLSVEIVPRI